MTNKKGVMGLSMASKFFISILSLVLIGILALVIWGSLGNDILREVASGTVTNEAGYINQTGYTLTYATLTDFSPTLTAWNSTSGQTILSGNYTITSGLLRNATATQWNAVEFNYTYTYTQSSNSGHIVNNASSGITSFFSNVPTWLVLVGVVIIILIIAAVIVVINRFSSE